MNLLVRLEIVFGILVIILGVLLTQGLFMFLFAGILFLVFAMEDELQYQVKKSNERWKQYHDARIVETHILVSAGFRNRKEDS